MAREMYLAGVKPEELVKAPEAPPPRTPREKWANFWYHHKWKVILGAVLLLTLAVLLGQSLTRVQPDYVICMVTAQGVSVDSDQRVEELLEAYADDRNGDGRVRVEVICLNVESGAEAVSNQQTVLAHLMARDVDAWAITPSYYTGTMHTAFNGNESDFFMPLTDMAGRPGVSDDGKYWNWKGCALLDTDEQLWSVPKELYWGVRALPDNATDEQQAAAQSAAALIRAFAEAQEQPAA